MGLRRYDAYVDGAWVPARSGERFESFHPGDGVAFATVAACDAPDVDAAVAGATKAFTAWRAMAPADRGRVLCRIAAAIDERRQHFAELESLDTGKPVDQAMGEIVGSARYFEFYGTLADKIHGGTIPLGDGYLSYTRREPYGVVGVIIPWNGPLNQAARSVAPALATGNTVVVKPAEQTPATCLELAELAVECGLPPGACNVVPGFGETAGAAVAEHPGVRKVVFTGSVETGRLVAAAAGRRIVPATLELGGKSAHIVFADADLEEAARSAQAAINVNAGQVCSAGSRLLVEQAVHDEVVERLVALNRTVAVGPASARPDMGPLISPEQRERVASYLRLAEEEGARAVVGAERSDLPPGGCFVKPVVLTGVTNDMRVAREEIFGPVLCVIPFDGEEQAVTLANDSEYGLVAGIWTRDLARAHRVAARLEVGQVFVNQYFAGGVETPFGGVKNSGYGREKGVEGALEYTQVKTVTVRL